jgi:sarcosine oxidase subunit beta
MKPDVVVLGAGVVGASIAYHLARQGARVLLADRGLPAAAPSATWASAGGLRSQGRSPPERPISLRAAARWRTLAGELGADLEAGFGGHLHVAETETEAAAVEQRIAVERSDGVPIERVSGKDLAAIAPALTAGAIVGAFTPGDGQAHPGRTARAFAAAAVRLGAEIRLGEAARLAVGPDDKVTAHLGGEAIAADQIVLATGAWSIAILDALGLVLPLRWRGLQMLLSEIAPALLAPTVTAVGRNLSLKQLSTGQVMVGGRWLAAPVAGCVAAEPIEANVGRQWAGAAALVPAFASLALAQTWAGVEAQTFDALPFIGPAPVRGLYVATGFSNHGFQIAPAVGELVAADLLTHEPLLAPFRIERAAHIDASAIARFRAEPIDS